MSTFDQNGLGGWFTTLTALASPGHSTLTRRPLYEGVPQLRLRPATGGVLRRIVRAISNWMERERQRRALASLDDRLLDDIGLTRADVERELRLPIWRA